MNDTRTRTLHGSPTVIARYLLVALLSSVITQGTGCNFLNWGSLLSPKATIEPAPPAQPTSTAAPGQPKETGP